MSETQQKAWFRRPRYSLLSLAVFLVLATGTTMGGAWWCLNQTMNAFEHRTQQLLRATVSSPLPDIAVAARSSGPMPLATAYQKPYQLSKDWFTTHIPVWQKVLEPYKGKPGGLMIFDDYPLTDRTWDTATDGDTIEWCPRLAIDPFVQCFEDRCEVVHREWQLIIRKTRE